MTHREHKLKCLRETVASLEDGASIRKVMKILRESGFGLRYSIVQDYLREVRPSHYEVAEKRRQMVRQMGPVGTSEIAKALRLAGLRCDKSTARRIRREVFGSVGVNP